MNYAWEVVLEADKNLIPRENLRFHPVNNGSPYTEAVFENFNINYIDETKIDINPLYRFSDEFSDIFDINLCGLECTRELMFDILMHYFVELDLRQGMDRQEYSIRFLLNDLLEGVCGLYTAETIVLFGKKHLHRLLQLILKLYKCGSSIDILKEVMRYLYPNSLVYVNNDNIRQILIYVGKNKTDIERKKLEFLQRVFLPIYYDVFIFWECHFGIIDVEETMELDNMVIF